MTAENHNVTGGLFSAVAEVLSREAPTLMAAIGINDMFGEVGKLPYLKQRFGMTGEDIARACRDIIKKKAEIA